MDPSNYEQLDIRSSIKNCFPKTNTGTYKRIDHPTFSRICPELPRSTEIPDQFSSIGSLPEMCPDRSMCVGLPLVPSSFIIPDSKHKWSELYPL